MDPQTGPPIHDKQLPVFKPEISSQSYFCNVWAEADTKPAWFCYLDIQQYCRGLHNYQCPFEVYLRYVLLWLYSEYGTIMLITEAQQYEKNNGGKNIAREPKRPVVHILLGVEVRFSFRFLDVRQDMHTSLTS